MGVIVKGLGTPRSTGENFRCTREHLEAPATSRVALPTSLGVPLTNLASPRITVEQSGKYNIFFGNAAGAPGNHSYYLLSIDF